MEKKLRDMTLEPPRFVDGKPMLVAGLGARFDYDNMDGLPALWQRFQPHIGNIPKRGRQAPPTASCTSSDADGFDYIAGVEVTAFSRSRSAK